MINRRRFVGATAVGLATASVVGARRASAQAQEIRIIESGGKSGEGIQVSYIEPFTRKTGIKVVRESPNPLSRLRALVMSGQTDIVLFETNVAQARRLNLIEPIDWAAVNPAPMFPEAKNEFGFGYQYYSNIMAWRAGMKEPKSWAEFFDTKAFPGKRALPDNPVISLPFAVLATGVPGDKLYPLDVEAGLKKLNEIKKDVSVWWKTAAQAPQLLRDNEVQYAIAYSGRVAGDPNFGVSFAGGTAALSYFCIVKNSKPKDRAAAYKLMHEMSLPENQARAAEVIPYTGPSPELDRFLPKDKLWQFPTSSQNKAVQFVQDDEWWADNGEAVNKKWEAFKLNL